MRVLEIHSSDTTPDHTVGEEITLSHNSLEYDGDFIYLYSRDEKNKLLLTYARVEEVESPPLPAPPPLPVFPTLDELEAADADPIIDNAVLPTDYDERKALLVAAVLDYFPLAVVAVSRVIGIGQKQHGTVGWDRAKSADDSNTLIRHFLERGSIDTDGVPHSAKMVWRALAILQKEEERRLGVGISRGSYDSSKGEKGPRQP